MIYCVKKSQIKLTTMNRQIQNRIFALYGIGAVTTMIGASYHECYRCLQMYKNPEFKEWNYFLYYDRHCRPKSEKEAARIPFKTIPEYIFIYGLLWPISLPFGALECMIPSFVVFMHSSSPKEEK